MVRQRAATVSPVGPCPDLIPGIEVIYSSYSYFIFERGYSMKKIVFMTACFLIAASTVWCDSDWLYFIDTEKGEKCYIDLASIKHVSGHMVEVKRKVEPNNSSDIASLVSHLEMDCSGNRMRVLKKVTYYKSGKTGTEQGDASFRNIGAEDFEESLMELVCSLKKRGYRE